MHNYCGIDFGTSNSTIGVWHNDQASLAPLEKHHTTIPTAIFFDYENPSILYGREAMNMYIEGTEGRLMRSLKSILGSSLMDEKTIVSGKRTSYVDIIGMFLKQLKHKAEQHLKSELTQIVLGRPVYFVDDDKAADQSAQDALEKAANTQGFQHIEFQYEPIAAALDYEQSVTKEKVALIVDIGGGTSDFSIVKVSPENKKKQNRKDDILANLGVHIGGNDFDKELNLNKVMPHLGYKSEIWNFTKTEKLFVPKDYFISLATWNLINTLYTRERQNDIKKMMRDSLAPELLTRLLKGITDKQGHRILADIEQAKITLSVEDQTKVALPYIDKNLATNILRTDFENTIEKLKSKIVNTIKKAIAVAGISSSQIDAVFLTGGSTSIPYIRNSVLSLFENAEHVRGDLFGSVGTGLAIEAHKLYG